MLFDQLPFDDLRDPVTGRTKVRLVDIESEHYRVARDYMIRLEPNDLEDEETLRRLADAARMSPEAFRHEFAGVVRAGELVGLRTGSRP